MAGDQSGRARASSPQPLETIILAAIATVAAVGVVAWAAVHATVLATEGHPARGPWIDVLRGLGRLPSDPGDPSAAFPPGAAIPGPVAFWAVFTATAAVCTVTAGLILRRTTTAARRGRLSLPGRRDLAELGPRPLARRSGRLRPSLPGRGGAPQVGVRLGVASSAGSEVWASAEDTIVVYGPPRSGKSMYVVIPAVLDWPGPVVVTGTRPDVLVHTLRSRATQGTTAVFDPLGSWPAGAERWRLRWSPVTGCEAPEVAWRRARVLVESSDTGKGVENATYWTRASTTVLRALLHAAALDGRTAAAVRRWAADPTDDEPVHVLRALGPPGWGDELHAGANADPRTVSNVYAGVRQAVDVLGLPQVAGLCDIDPGQSWSPDQFLDATGALYVLGTPAEQSLVAPLVAALVDATVHAAERRAAAAPGGRLDPPLLLALDEVANIAPLPGLPQLLATGGGSGLVTMAVLQSPSQARARWGRDGAGTIRDASRIRMVLGGLAAGDDLEELSRSWGERDDRIRSSSIDAKGRRAVSDSTRRLRVAPVEVLRGLPAGTAMVAAGAYPPIELRMRPWWDRPDRRSVTAARSWAEAGGLP